MISEHTLRRRVEFSETDMAGIVHFSRYFNYMEAVEHDLFRRLGLSVVTQLGDSAFGWPRVNVSCDFRKPLRFEDEFEVKLIVREVRSKAIVFDFEFYRLAGDDDDKPIATGSMTTVCVTHDSTGSMRAATIPDTIRNQLTPRNTD